MEPKLSISDLAKRIPDDAFQRLVEKEMAGYGSLSAPIVRFRPPTSKKIDLEPYVKHFLDATIASSILGTDIRNIRNQFDTGPLYTRINELTDVNDPESVSINIQFQNGMISYIEARELQDKLKRKQNETDQFKPS